MEVVIAVSLFALVSVVSVSMVTNLVKSSVKSQANVDIEQASNFVLLKLQNDISKAYSASVDSTGKILTLTQPSPTAPITATYKIVTGSSGYISVDYGSGATNLTDSATVLIDTTSSFSVVSDATSDKDLAVNVTIKFITPGAAGDTKTFSAESALNTTIVLNGAY